MSQVSEQPHRHLAELRRRLRQTGGRGRKLRGLLELLRPYRARTLLMLGSLAFRIISADAYRATREKVAAITAYLQETLSGIRVVRSFAQEERHLTRFAELNDENREANMKTVNLNAAYFPSVELLSGLATAGILLYGGIQAINGE
ncbi:MAG TPA: ABC transporter transmembrane domain-containing protein, partial [Solirubrobacteraceae bacterium]|nr:ABC transporter transmembrane domain-containing protein [Solirubrobacteraceae bacterium]